MPDHDVTLYGEWKVQTGTFEPTITKTVISNKSYYRVGDAVRFKITVSNTASFPIRNVMVKENNNNSAFESHTGYTVLSDHVANIDTLAANSSIDLYASYTVLANDSGTITNEAEIKGALADNDYQLVDKEYKASDSFKIQSKIMVCKEISSSYNENTFQFHVMGTTNQYETWITLETITSDGSNLIVAEGHDYEITYTNEFVKKGFLHSFGRVVNKVVQGGS